MDSRTFDRMVAHAVRRPSRRTALRLLVGGLASGLFAQRGSPFARAAQRADQDGDGFYDDDESLYYGTDPYTYDSDFDGVSDGEEIYYGTNPLVPEGVVRETATTYQEPTGASADPNTGAVQIGGVNSGGDGTCRGTGVPCDYNYQCCGATVFCCWDGISLRTECTDVTPYGGVCPI